MERPHIIKFSRIGDETIGYLSIAENKKNIPFDIKRVYWVYGTPETVERGNHTHKEGCQVLIALAGKIKVELENKAGEKTTYNLNTPSEGLYIPKMHWRKLRFGKGAICFCLADTTYDPGDYIRQYEEFKAK